MFEHAQKILRKTVGMELVELRSRAELERDAVEGARNNEDDLEEARKATEIKKKGKTSISPSRVNSYLV